MADVFISYKSDDRAAASLYSDALTAEGFSVWWDPVLRTGETYDEVIERNLREAAIVVVLWSPRSVRSKWVRAEATIGERKGGLLPILIEACDRPIAFELTQTADLCGWTGDRADARWIDFVNDLRAALAKGKADVRAHTAPPPPDADTIEMLYWSSIKDSNEAADFDTYLARYPHGQFVDLAWRKLAKSRGLSGGRPLNTPVIISWLSLAGVAFAMSWVNRTESNVDTSLDIGVVAILSFVILAFASGTIGAATARRLWPTAYIAAIAAMLVALLTYMPISMVVHRWVIESRRGLATGGDFFYRSQEQSVLWTVIAPVLSSALAGATAHLVGWLIRRGRDPSEKVSQRRIQLGWGLLATALIMLSVPAGMLAYLGSVILGLVLILAGSARRRVLFAIFPALIGCVVPFGLLVYATGETLRPFAPTPYWAVLGAPPLIMGVVAYWLGVGLRALSRPANSPRLHT